MKRRFLICAAAVFLVASLCEAGFLDDVMKKVGDAQGKGPSENTTVSGLKEALSISTERTL